MATDNPELFAAEEERDDPAALAEEQSKLQERCKAAGIDCERRERGGDLPYLRVGMPNGRDKRWLLLFGLASVKELLSISFEEFTFLGRYEAICSYKLGRIEALIRGPGIGGSHMIRHRILQDLGDVSRLSSSQPGAVIVSRCLGGEQVTLSIRSRSHEFKVLTRGYARDSAIVLQVTGVRVSQHDQALELLEKLSNALFFQIDLLTDVPISLVKARTRPQRRELRGRRSFDLQFPDREYDLPPISLYWYARTAIGMPLLQFLAYYQVLEFYFPIFSQAEAKRRAQTILRDPTFRIDKDADVGRLIAAISMRGNGYGEERSQLRSVINSCVDPRELRAFFEGSEQRVAFFSTKHKGLTDRKIPFGNLDADIRNDVSDLIYEIRCRVVHTKGDAADGDIELLLPFSKEADSMEPYVELIQVIATKVLISASSPLAM